MTQAREICKALGGRWHGTYGLCFCPAHQNANTPALSLKDGDDGKLLVFCHAGCDGADVMAALRVKGLLEGSFDWKPDPEKAKQHKGARSTRGRAWTLLYSEAWPTREEAMSREWYLKRDRALRRRLALAAQVPTLDAECPVLGGKRTAFKRALKVGF